MDGSSKEQTYYTNMFNGSLGELETPTEHHAWGVALYIGTVLGQRTEGYQGAPS